MGTLEKLHRKGDELGVNGVHVLLVRCVCGWTKNGMMDDSSEAFVKTAKIAQPRL